MDGYAVFARHHTLVRKTSSGCLKAIWLFASHFSTLTSNKYKQQTKGVQSHFSPHSIVHTQTQRKRTIDHGGGCESLLCVFYVHERTYRMYTKYSRYSQQFRFYRFYYLLTFLFIFVEKKQFTDKINEKHRV